MSITPEPSPAAPEPPADTETGPPFLLAEDLAATGPEGPVYTGVHLAASPGDLVAIAGPGGTGRTSLLLTLTGRFTARRGRLAVAGRTDPAAIRAASSIAAAPPALAPDEHLTVGDLVAETVLTGHGVTRPAVTALLRRLGISPDSGTRYGHLDAVTRTLLAIALAAAEDTPVLAADDVDTGLDPTAADRVWAALRSLAADGRLVLAVAARPGPADVTVHLTPQDHR